MDSGAWPFLVGGLICLVNSVNERDLVLLTRNWNNNLFIIAAIFTPVQFGGSGGKGF